MKKIALLLAVTVYAASLTGCGCCRRVRGTLCRGAICGTRTAPVLSPVRAPAPAPVVIPQQAPIVAAPQVVSPPVIQPQVIQPQVIHAPQVYAPQCQCAPPVRYEPDCAYQPPVCEPCYSGYAGDCGCYGGDIGCYSGDCSGCDTCQGAPYGIEVQEGEYFGGVETNDSGWEENKPTEAGDAADDPEPL